MAARSADHPAPAGRTLGQAIDPAAFAEAFSHLATSVWVASAGIGAARVGRTVTSLMSLSAAPPRVVVSVTAESALARAILDEGGFALSLLARGQDTVADGFAGALPQDQRFSNAVWSAWPSGRPRLDGAVLDLDCALDDVVPSGSHHLMIGTVIASRIGAAEPLLWHRRGYKSLGSPDRD